MELPLEAAVTTGFKRKKLEAQSNAIIFYQFFQSVKRAPSCQLESKPAGQ